MNFVDCDCFFGSNSPDILALCEANLDDSIDPVKVYPLLIGKDSATHMHGLAVYVKEGLPFAQDLSLEKFLLVFLTGFTLFSILLLFPLLIIFFNFMHSF